MNTAVCSDFVVFQTALSGSSAENVGDTILGVDWQSNPQLAMRQHIQTGAVQTDFVVNDEAHDVDHDEHEQDDDEHRPAGYPFAIIVALGR